MSQDLYPISRQVAEIAHLTAEQYQTMYNDSIRQPERFWGAQGEALITWFAPWEKVLTGGFNPVDVEWFVGGKLNASYNCLDRHLENDGDKTAIIWQGDDPSHSQKLSYRELHARVCRFANVLKRLGVKLGDRVCIYLPMIPEAAIAMLACSRIGAIHSVVFAGFSADALATRIQDAGCSLVITANESVRNNKAIPLKANVDQALADCPSVKRTIIVQHTPTEIAFDPARDVWYHDAIADMEASCPPAIMDASAPLFILYTSGSTGRPKGILHNTGGYLVYAAITFKYVFDYHPEQIYWCTADVGWITGHTYGIYGPLLNAATIVMFEGVPTYPTPSRVWETIDKYQVNIFYTAPTAIRALRREGDDWVKKTSRSSLQLLGTVGEPINPDAWLWFYDVVGQGNCPVVDTWWQTETGGIMISALPGAMPLKPGSAAKPFFGIAPLIVDDNGKPLPPDQMGKLVITQPWPGMMKTIYNDQARFVENYFAAIPDYYSTGDQAHVDQDGYFWISGRSDDVIKVSGHRIGTEEVESALVHHTDVSEAAVVAIPDDVKGQSIYAFVTLKKGVNPSNELAQSILKTVRDVLSPIAVPDHLQWAEELPKTRSGKIMRRILRKIATNETDDLGDVSTLLDPGVIEKLMQGRG